MSLGAEIDGVYDILNPRVTALENVEPPAPSSELIFNFFEVN